ncbi:hypothetical protein [Stenotrophomonas sp.]|uniref:hypothetical protein n=1 Tax=Stenotrophomonas sp. TaxID=69392 RepID=UPI002FCADA4E
MHSYIALARGAAGIEVQQPHAEMEFDMFGKVRTSMFAVALLAASVFGAGSAMAADNTTAADVIIICDADLCVIIIL